MKLWWETPPGAGQLLHAGGVSAAHHAAHPGAPFGDVSFDGEKHGKTMGKPWENGALMVVEWDFMGFESIFSEV